MTNVLMAILFILWGLGQLIGLNIPAWVLGVLALIVGILLITGTGWIRRNPPTA